MNVSPWKLDIACNNNNQIFTLKSANGINLHKMYAISPSQSDCGYLKSKASLGLHRKDILLPSSGTLAVHERSLVIAAADS